MALAHWLRGYLYGDVEGDYDRAINEIKTTIQLMPADMDPKLNLSFYLLGAGKPDEAIASLDWLGADGKTDPSLAAGFCNRGFAYFVKKDYKQAVDNVSGLTNANPYCLSILAATYIQMGEIEKAKDYVKKILLLDPKYTVDLFRRGNNILDKKALGRLTDSLRQAGLPEA